MVLTGHLPNSDYQEWEKMARNIKANFPLAGPQFEKV
jgi:hypothetical protein